MRTAEQLYGGRAVYRLSTTTKSKDIHRWLEVNVPCPRLVKSAAIVVRECKLRGVSKEATVVQVCERVNSEMQFDLRQHETAVMYNKPMGTLSKLMRIAVLSYKHTDKSFKLIHKSFKIVQKSIPKL